jgi:acetolactate synthase-1/2/3 large subunit
MRIARDREKQSTHDDRNRTPKGFGFSDAGCEGYWTKGSMMNGGQALVKICERAGVDYIFSSPGTEWPPVWEALAEGKQKGVERLNYINCRHESLAVGMAASYTKVTRKTQVVLLHATVGALNAGMMLRAVYQERIPMVVCAGESATYGEDERMIDPGGQWLQSLSDLGRPADMLRRCVKWSDRISSSAVLVPLTLPKMLG